MAGFYDWFWARGTLGVYVDAYDKIYFYKEEAVMPSDMDHLHGTDTRDARMAALQAEIARLRKERDRFVRFVVTDTEAQMIGQFAEEINRLSTENAELRRDKERLLEACRFAHSLLDSHSRSADRIEEKLRQAIEAAKGQDGAVVVAPAGDSPLRELYESPEFRAAWANREEK